MDPRDRFIAAVTGPAADVPLDIAALCIAAHAHPGLDVDDWSARLDALAAGCPAPTFDALRAHLFEQIGFAGNLDHYDDPENSFLDSVIERRRGIPISLSVLMIAIGRRLGIDVQGVGMPGHFLVLDAARGDMWCDPFHGGSLLDADGCRRRFEMVYGGALAFQLSFLMPTPARAIVARILANLERGKLATDPVQRAWMCELHLAIPGITANEQLELADQLAATGDIMRAAVEFDRLADRIESEPPAAEQSDMRHPSIEALDPDAFDRAEQAAGDAAARLRTRARALRARLN